MRSFYRHWLISSYHIGASASASNIGGYVERHGHLLVNSRAPLPRLCHFLHGALPCLRAIVTNTLEYYAGRHCLLHYAARDVSAATIIIIYYGQLSLSSRLRHFTHAANTSLIIPSLHHHRDH